MCILSFRSSGVWTDAAMDGAGAWKLMEKDEEMVTEDYTDLRYEGISWLPPDSILNVNGTTKGCLELTSSGLLNAKIDEECDTEQKIACEYTACTTITGKKCLFPYRYMNDTHPDLTYKICSSLDVYRPWCPTKLDEQLNVLEWGDCLDDCPSEPVNSACIEEPEFPEFSDGEDPLVVNYTSSYERGSGIVTDEVSCEVFGTVKFKTSLKSTYFRWIMLLFHAH